MHIDLERAHRLVAERVQPEQPLPTFDPARHPRIKWQNEVEGAPEDIEHGAEHETYKRIAQTALCAGQRWPRRKGSGNTS